MAEKTNRNFSSQNKPFGSGRSPRGGAGRGGRSTKPAAGELEQKILAIRRVARVVRGGRRFNFSVVLAVGNRQGKVGLGLGKARDVSSAIEKALYQAKKRVFTVARTKSGSLPHQVEVKYGAARLFMKPAPGRGLVAGSSARTIFGLAGVSDISAKILSKSKNKLNNARLAIKALHEIK